MRRWALLVLCLLWAAPAWAADFYVRQGAAGANNGTDWTNAWTTLAAAETAVPRGTGTNVIWVADTTTGLSGQAFNTANSGTNVITVKKATVAAHGTSTGWLDSYGDGQALFTGEWSVTTDYWLFDGVTGGGPGSWESGFGFRIKQSGGGATKVIRYTGADNVTFQHIDAENSGEDVNGNADTLYTLGATNVTFRYMWLHNTNRTNLLIAGTSTGFVIEYSLISERHNLDGAHGEHFSINGSGTPCGCTIRYSIFRDAGGANTGVIVIKDSVQSGWDIYGNIFYVTDYQRYGVTNGILTDSTGDSTTSARIFNNTIMPHKGTGSADGTTAAWDVATGNVFQGNLVFNNGGFDGVQTRSYNTYDTSSLASGDAAGGQFYSGTEAALFQDPVSFDYRLKIATSDATAASIPFATDQLGVTRGGDGNWDRGAFEFVSGAVFPDITITAPTASPTYQTNVTPLTTLAGTCVDDGTVSSVTWTNSLGGSGTATGTTSWSVASIALTAGDNTITVTCTDDMSNTAQAALVVMYVAIPATPMDTFNRSSSGSLGPNWTNQSTLVLSVAGQQAISTAAGWHPAVWAVHDTPDNQFSQITVRDFSGTSRNTGVTCRAAGTTSTTWDAYLFTTNGLSGAGNTQLNRVVDGVVTVLTSYATTFVAGDVSRMECTGSSPVSVVVYKNGVQVGTTYEDSDAARLTTGEPGIAFYGVNAAGDDWSAGESAPPADTIPPDVTITAPTSLTSYQTSTTPITVAGTASDTVGVSSCTYSTNQSESGALSGTTSWTGSVPLHEGSNVVTVDCVDAVANHGTDQIDITLVIPASTAPVRLRVR